MKNRKCLVNVSLVFFDNFDKGKIETSKLEILKNLLRVLNRDINIHKILIIDNSPLEILPKYLCSLSKVNYIFAYDNLGFSKAHNLSRKYLLDEKYHLIINPDIIIEDENLITKLVNYLNQNDDTAMIQPLIIGYPDKKIQFLCKRNPTLVIQILRGFFNNLTNKFKFLRNYNFWYEMRDLAYKKEVVESTYLSGAFMFCRTSILNKINWFDERFFMYLEDADLTRRLSKCGKCVHHPLFTVRHVWARGSHKSIFLKLIAIVSYFKYSQKWGFKIF